MNSLPSFAESVSIKTELESELTDASRVLNSFPRGFMGLTTDEAKATPEWKLARARCDAALKKVQSFNRAFIKQHGKQWREFLHSKRTQPA